MTSYAGLVKIILSLVEFYRSVDTNAAVIMQGSDLVSKRVGPSHQKLRCNSLAIIYIQISQVVYESISPYRNFLRRYVRALFLREHRNASVSVS